MGSEKSDHQNWDNTGTRKRDEKMGLTNFSLRPARGRPSPIGIETSNFQASQNFRQARDS